MCGRFVLLFISRRFILHGVLKGYIRRLHKYPIYSHWTESSSNRSGILASSSSLSTGHVIGFSQVAKYLNGLHHYDQVCSLLGCSAKELDDILYNEPDVYFIYK
jgi:hypothetical protein